MTYKATHPRLVVTCEYVNSYSATVQTDHETESVNDNTTNPCDATAKVRNDRETPITSENTMAAGCGAVRASFTVVSQ